MKSKILHLSLAHGAGVITALESYIENSDYADHYLIAAIDESCQVNVSDKNNLKRTYFITKNLSGLLEIRRIFSDIKPTHIHLHSSIAGLVGRVLFPFFDRIIYTPHCFAFERNDVPYIFKKAFYLAELLLSFKSVVIAGCSPREVDLANQLTVKFFKKKNKNIFLTNYSNLSLRWTKPKHSMNKVIMIGRGCPQKDPDFFIETYKVIKKLDNSIQFLWIGGGDISFLNKLESNGVGCTGWLTRENLLKEVMASDLYFHCASWEGNPMSVLEVCRMEMPILGREIEPLKSIGMKNLAETPHECATLIFEALSTGKTRNIDHQSVNDLCSIDSQKKALKIIYGY